MKAIVYSRYGSPDVLRLEDVEPPVVGEDQVLVRVRAASVNPYDWHLMRGLPYVMRLASGLRGPKRPRLGLDLAGEVEAVGAKVTRFRPGDAVFGMQDGSFAELVSVPEQELVEKPAGLGFEEAAAVPLGALTALQGLRDAGKLTSGQRVLVIGASGGVGIFAVQIARHLGAHVTGVCSGGKAELVRSLGADEVIDYTTEDFVERPERYDLILELAGTRSPLELRRALTPTGRLVLSSGESSGRWIGPIDRLLLAAVVSPFVKPTLCTFTTHPSREDLELVKELIEAGRLRPVIDRTYALGEVPEALRHLERGHARGKTVIVS